MIRTQWLLRLMAASGVLGWAGEAAAAIKLTLNREYYPSNFVLVREDAGETNIEVTAQNYAGDPSTTSVETVGEDTYVTLGIESLGGCSSRLNSRYRITLPTLIILAGKSEATGALTFIPIDDELKGNDTHDEGEGTCDDSPENNPGDGDDLVLQITGNAGAHEVTTGPRLHLADDDKASTNISLSVSESALSKEAGATDIVVRAELNGKVLTTPLTFHLGIQTAPNHAVRDVDYAATNLGRITIPKNKASGQTTITITPKAQGTGIIRLVGRSSSHPNIAIGHQQIELKEPPAAIIKGLTARPSLIREDQGPTNIELTVELQDALAADSEVLFTLVSNGDDLSGNDALNAFFSDAEPAVRDVHYTATIGGLTIRQGETVGTTTLTLTPIDNERVNSAKAFELTAKVGTTHLLTGIKITDDETTSENITLAVSHNELREDAGETEIAVTATLDGKVLAQDVTVVLLLDDSDAATALYAIDFTALLRSVTIPAGQAQGVQTISITPNDDGIEDADEKIILKALKNPQSDDRKEIAVSTATITLKDTGPRADASPTGDTTPAFVENQSDISATVGKAMRPLELPPATGDGNLTYSVSNALPAGLSFDRATRIIAGTPTAVGTATITYTVIDGDATKPESAVILFKIAIYEAPPPVVAVASVASTHSSLRENGETTAIILTATLAAAAPAAETIRFTIVAPTQGPAAVRDVDYSATLAGPVSIAAGATQATTTLRLTPFDNDKVDGHTFLGVQATASGGSAQTDIKIADDETTSTSIALSVHPHIVREGTGPTTITVTATLDGKALAQDATATLSIDAASAAQRDLDYSALFDPLLVIPAGSIAGEISLSINPIDDDEDEGNETITLNGAIEGLAGGSTTITLTDAAIPLAAPAATLPLAFAEGTSVATQRYTAGTQIAALELPAASGGAGDATYRVSGLPAGLAFDAATRIIAGTPEVATAGPVEITYTATDGDGAIAALTFSIVVNPPLAFESHNYPNPFNPTTTIKYALPTAMDVKLTVYNVVGQAVRTLVAKHQNTGHYRVEWDATDDSGHSVSAGIYFYRLQAGETFLAVEKMLLLK